MKRVWNEISIGGKKLSPSLKSVITSLYADDSDSMINILGKDRMRSGDLLRAWSWVEINMKMAMENYRKTVEHISSLVAKH